VKNSPLQLEDYFVSDLQFSLLLNLKDVPPSGQDFDPVNMKLNAKTEMRERNPRKWRCVLRVGAHPKEGQNYPYSFSIEYTGFFSVIDEFPAEFVEQMVRTNAPAVLYSSAREALMHLTGRGRLTAVLLPSITFLELPKGKKAARATLPRRIAKKK
jgi:preprotein translocase subunit SecB